MGTLIQNNIESTSSLEIIEQEIFIYVKNNFSVVGLVTYSLIVNIFCQIGENKICGRAGPVLLCLEEIRKTRYFR